MESPCVKANTRLINYRPLFEIAVGIMFGVAASGYLSVSGVYILAAALLIAIGIFALIIKSWRSMLFTGAILFGILMAIIAAANNIQPGEYHIEGIIQSINEGEWETELVLTNTALDDEPTNTKIALKIEDDLASNFEVGDEIEAYGSVSIPSKSYGAFDEKRYYLSRDIGVIAEADEIHFISSGNLPITKTIVSIRTAIVEKVYEIFGSDGNLMASLFVGWTNEMPEERETIYRIAGSSHILSISGFHMSIIVMAIAFILPKNRRWLRLITITICMFIYGAICVYTAGISRSAIMTTCLLLAICLERRNDPISALSLAAILILIANPFQLYSVAFQFSFSACFGIFTIGRKLEDWLSKLHVPYSLGIGISVGASLATTMFQMQYFGTFSPYVLFGNLVAVPAFSLILIFGIIVTAIGFLFPGAAMILAYAPRAVLFVSEKYLSAIAKMPYSVISFKPPSIICCVLMLIAIFIVSDYVLCKPKKKLEYLGIIALLFTISFFMGIM